jgi:hypothetical protein
MLAGMTDRTPARCDGSSGCGVIRGRFRPALGPRVVLREVIPGSSRSRPETFRPARVYTIFAAPANFCPVYVLQNGQATWSPTEAAAGGTHRNPLHAAQRLRERGFRRCGRTGRPRRFRLGAGAAAPDRQARAGESRPAGAVPGPARPKRPDRIGSLHPHFPNLDSWSGHHREAVSGPRSRFRQVAGATRGRGCCVDLEAARERQDQGAGGAEETPPEGPAGGRPARGRRGAAGRPKERGKKNPLTRKQPE